MIVHSCNDAWILAQNCMLCCSELGFMDWVMKGIRNSRLLVRGEGGKQHQVQGTDCVNIICYVFQQLECLWVIGVDRPSSDEVDQSLQRTGKYITLLQF